MLSFINFIQLLLVVMFIVIAFVKLETILGAIYYYRSVVLYVLLFTLLVISGYLGFFGLEIVVFDFVFVYILFLIIVSISFIIYNWSSDKQIVISNVNNETFVTIENAPKTSFNESLYQTGARWLRSAPRILLTALLGAAIYYYIFKEKPSSQAPSSDQPFEDEHFETSSPGDTNDNSDDATYNDDINDNFSDVDN